MFNWMNNISIAVKIWFAPGLLLLALLGEGLFSVYLEKEVNDKVRVITEDLSADANLSATILTDILQQRLTLKSYLQTSDEKFVEAFRAEEAASGADLDKARESIANPERRQLVEEIASLHHEYSRQFGEVVVKNMARRHELVSTKLDANGPPMEDTPVGSHENGAPRRRYRSRLPGGRRPTPPVVSAPVCLQVPDEQR